MNAKLESILIIETDQGMQNLIRSYLKNSGAQFTLIEAWNSHAIEQVRAGRFDLAIIDWKTKIQPAFDIYKMLRALPALNKTPVVFISGQITRDDILRTAADPLTKFVVKPFTEDLLFKAIREMNQKSLEQKTKKVGNIVIHRGNKPQARDSAEIIKSEQGEKSGLDLFQGESRANHARPESLSSQDMISDIDMEEQAVDRSESQNSQDSSSLDYTKAPQGSASSFDYRLMQKLSNHGKPKSEAGIDVLIIDDDEMLTNLVQNHLSSTKTDYVEVCNNATDGWAAILRYGFKLIVMDWRCKGMSGLALYNRIRSRPESAKTPILILTGGIERDSFKMIEDKKLTMVLEKPFEMKLFEKAVDSIRKLESNDLQTIELAVQTIDACEGDRKLILTRVIATAGKLSSKFDFLLACGQYLIHLGDYGLALKVLEGASKLNPENVTVMTELAKVYLRLNRPTDSLKLLNLANQFSPGNIQRLCLMGEVGLDLFDTDRAREYFSSALDIDRENIAAQRGVTLANNLAEFTAAQGFKPLKEQFASTLNLIGITLIKNGQIEKGIEQYHCAMAFITDGPTLAKLQFNLALAYHRLGNKVQAIEWLEEALRSAGGLFPKASTWILRVRGELKRGKDPTQEASPINWDSSEFLDSLADSLQKLMDDE